MFERVLLLLLILPAAAFGQVRLSPETLAQQARIDSMIPLWRTQWAAARQEDSIRHAELLRNEEQRFDTLDVHPFRVIAPHSASERVFPEFRRAIADRAAMLEGIRTAEPYIIFVEPGKQIQRYQLMAKGHQATSISLPVGIRSAWHHRAVRNTLDNVIATFLPDSVKAWLLNSDVSAGRALPRVYREMAVADVVVTERCRAGAVPSCLDALELTGKLDSLRGHTPDQIRAMVARHAREVFRGTAYLNKQCVKGHDLAACMEQMRSFGGLPLPLSSDARASFLLTALRVGGRGAIARMQARANASAGEAIAAAAGQPLQQIGQSWRADLIDAGRNTRAGLVTGVLAAFLWASVALAFALRSTRRRIG